MDSRPYLKDTFEKLGVNTGTLTESELNSWWDNDNSVVSILEFVSSLDENNVLTVDEKEWYSLNKHSVSFLPPEECKREFDELDITYPGIQDLKALEKQIECLENELQTLNDEEESLDHLLNVQKSIDYQLSKEFSDSTEDVVLITSKLSALSEQCLTVSFSLNENRVSLFKKIQSICNHINEYDCAPEPIHFLSMPHDWLKFNFDLFMNHCNFILNKEMLGDSVCSFVMETPLRKLCCSSASIRMNTSKMNTSILVPPHIQSELEILQKRISKSVMGRIQCRLKTVESDVNIILNTSQSDMEFTRKFSPLKDSTWMNLPEAFGDSVVKSETSYMSDVPDYNKQKVDILMKQIEQSIEQMVESYTNYPRLYVSQVSLKNLKEQLSRLEYFDKYVTDFANLYLFISILYDLDLEEIHDMEKFFKDVLHYVNVDLVDCTNRTEHMQKVISDFNTYKNISFVEKIPILSTIMKLISNEEINEEKDFEDLVVAHNHFNQQILESQNRAFYKNMAIWQQGLKKTYEDLEQIEKFLHGGQTNNFVILVPKLRKLFKYSESLVTKRQAEVTAAIQCFNNTKNKISTNKWFRYKRQLWVYFLTNPQKLVQIIGQLENYLKSMV